MSCTRTGTPSRCACHITPVTDVSESTTHVDGKSLGGQMGLFLLSGPSKSLSALGLDFLNPRLARPWPGLAPVAPLLSEYFC